MIKIKAIQSKSPMMVTWDTGRRCNYDCTYCESTRHDTNSPYHKLDEYLKTFEFIKTWVDEYNRYRTAPIESNINFTGGEPTMNPNFWKLVEEIKDEKFNLSLTTNGAWNPKFTDTIIDNFMGVTVSYHTEAHSNLKKQVVENILELHKSNLWLQVNVMLHVDYWNESIKVYEHLKQQGIKVNPRPIGDGNFGRTGWFKDRDGIMRRTSHAYDDEQQQWYFNEMGITATVEEFKQGTELGRSCCGGRCTKAKVGDTWQEVKLVNTEFKDWNCMVDWFFLHIDQHTGDVFHHQTCQATHQGGRGPVGNLTDTESMINALKTYFENPQPIVCPNDRCGCGMCIPKAESKEDFEILWKDQVRSSSLS